MAEPTGSSSPHPRWGESASPDGSDPGTDPGRPHPYESLYRGHESGVPGEVRPTPRHYIPSVSRPDGAEAGYGWLYRDAAPPTPPVETWPPPVEAAPVRPSRRRLVITLVLVLSLAAGIAVGVVLYRRGSPSAGSPTPAQPSPVSTATSASSDPNGTDITPYAGAVGLLTPVKASADCQAKSATDDGGRKVSYGPANASDGDPSTAWRCDGDGVGHTLTFRFPAGSQVAEVGLINGYPKVDPTSGARRYGEYRRITAVTWTFPDGTSLRQPLSDDDTALQKLRIPVQTGDRVTMSIDATTKPGSTASTRNAVLIAEVTFGAPA